MAIAGAEFELAQEMNQLARNTDDADFAGGIFTSANNLFFDFALGLSYGIFDRRRINATVFHQTFKGIAGNLAANWVKTREYHHAWSVVNHNVYTRGTLQSLDVAAFFADDAALHVVIGQF